MQFIPKYSNCKQYGVEHSGIQPEKDSENILISDNTCYK